MISCPVCGEHLNGDGYKVALRCPGAPDELVGCAEPDASPIYCEQEMEERFDD